MNFYRALRTGVVSLVVVLVLLCATASTAVAQDQNDTDEIEEPENSIENELHDLLVRSVEYADGEFSLVVEWTGQTPETLTLTEMVQLDGSGTQGISMQTHRLYPGQQAEITIGAEQSGGTAAVILSTRQSIERGDALVIQEGEPTTREPVPFNLAALSVIGSALIGVAISVVLVVRKKNAEERGKERIA
jgi:hypothetical protein